MRRFIAPLFFTLLLLTASMVTASVPLPAPVTKAFGGVVDATAGALWNAGSAFVDEVATADDLGSGISGTVNGLKAGLISGLTTSLLGIGDVAFCLVNEDRTGFFTAIAGRYDSTATNLVDGSVGVIFSPLPIVGETAQATADGRCPLRGTGSGLATAGTELGGGLKTLATSFLNSE